MNPGNDHPEIPSLKPVAGKEEEKKGGGIVPSSAKPTPSSGFKFPGFGGGTSGSKAFSAPNLKVRGIGGGSTVMDRLKNLRKKDLIFIAAGLCTLGMAPLAEHLLMSPDDQTAKLDGGFGARGDVFGGAETQLPENGGRIGGPGGLIGQGSDVITPLNVRDPSNLIMSPGAQKKADAVVAPPPPPVPGKGESDWKDVLRDSAKSGAGKAAQQAPRPRPNVGKMAGAIRGLSALGGSGGGTGASLKLDALSASNVPNRAAGSNALTRSQATPGFRGIAARSGASSGAGEDLRAAGARQSDIFNKGGGAGAALDAASREAIPTGGAGSSGGRPGEGGETKNPGGNSQKDNKSLGESLAFLRQKMEMEKALDLKWEKKKWNEFGRQKMMEESALKLGFDMFGKFAEKAFINPLADAIGQAVAPGAGGPEVGYECTIQGQRQKISKANMARAGWQVVNGQLISKDGKIEGTGCTLAVVGGADGGTTAPPADRRSGGLAGAPGAGRMEEQERRMAQRAGQLDAERKGASALTEQIRGTCAGITRNTPALTKVGENCDAFQAQSARLTGGLDKLYAASDELGQAWGHLKTASGNMEAEQTKLHAAVTSLKGAADKLVAAEAALRIPEGQDKIPPDAEKNAKAAVDAARTHVEAAKPQHEQAKAKVAETNKALVDSDARGKAADTALGEANTAITGVTVPKAADEAGTTIQLAPFERDLTAAKERALGTWREVRVSYQTWKTGQDKGVASRDALHGKTAAATEMAINTAGSNEPVADRGALGTAYNNFGAHAVPLTTKTEPGPFKQAYTAAETAFKAAVVTCGTAPQCPQAVTDYNGAVTTALQATPPAQNLENQTAANRDLAAAVGQVQAMVAAVQNASPGQPTGGPGEQRPAGTAGGPPAGE